MLKICLCSDNHGDLDSLRKILTDNPACDYYLHCGDSMLDEETIAPFASVKGNCDYDDEFPKERIIELEGHRILIMHGNNYTFSDNLLVDKAKERNADIVFYGHTHIFRDVIIQGIRFINPGSSYHNRDLSNPCYARVYIDQDLVKAERIDL